MFDVQEKSCDQQGKIKKISLFQNAILKLRLKFFEICHQNFDCQQNFEARKIITRMGDHLMFKETDVNSPKERLLDH